MGFMQASRGLIVGIANERSLAYGVARETRAQGAELIVTYQNERMQPRVTQLARELGAIEVCPCDLTQPPQIAAVASRIYERWGQLDFVLHAVAHARRDELQGRFLDTSRDGFLEAMHASVYSLVALLQAMAPLLARSTRHPSVLTLTHLGSEKVVSNYNVMGVAKAALEAAVRYLAADLGPQGIRVNALSAGAVKTLSAAGIKGLRSMLQHSAQVAPLRRNIDLEDVGHAAALLLSPLGKGITAEVVHVDAGLNAIAALPLVKETPPP